MLEREHVSIVDRFERESWARLIYSDGLIAWIMWITSSDGERRPFASVCVEVLALADMEGRARVARTLRIYRAAQHRQQQAVDSIGLIVRRPLDPAILNALESQYPVPVVSKERRRRSARGHWQRAAKSKDGQQ